MRARRSNPRRRVARAVCYGTDPAHAHHVKACRPGRPLCKYRRLERENRRPCYCGAYPFAHRHGSGRCGDPEKMETFVHGPLRPVEGPGMVTVAPDEPDEIESFADWWERARRNPTRVARDTQAPGPRLRPYLFEAVFYSPHSSALYHHAVIDVDASSEDEARHKAYAVLVMHGKKTRVLGSPVELRPIGKRHRWADGYEGGRDPILRASRNPFRGPSKATMDVVVRVGLVAGVATLIYYALAKPAQAAP
jgi:hypothetical protein